MTLTIPTPLKIRRARYDRLSRKNRLAVANASDYLYVAGRCSIRIETYATAAIRRLLTDVWQWTAAVADLDFHAKDDRQRIGRLMRLIPKEGAWPYVSFRAADMEELMQTTQEDDYRSVPNHGDGWHRMVACIELDLPTIDVLFFEGDEWEIRDNPYL